MDEDAVAEADAEQAAPDEGFNPASAVTSGETDDDQSSLGDF